MPYTIDTARDIFPDTLLAQEVPTTVSRFSSLSAEDQLALIWFAYLEMGKTITVAALGATNMQFAEFTLNAIKNMTPAEQTQTMCDLANHADTEISRIYSTWTPNLKLGFWHQLGEWMNEGIVAPIPPGYQLSPNATDVLCTIKSLEPGQQITVLRNTVLEMGLDPALLGRYTTLQEKVEPPKSKSKRTQVSIVGVTNKTVLQYMDDLNANDFDSLIDLFTSDGALQPPFQRTIVGKESILRFFKEECQNLDLIPEKGISEPAEDGYTQIKVTGKCQTPWFKSGVRMAITWRFLLNPDNKIFFVAIDLLPSAKELLSMKS